jgi:hypothetical protein
MWLGFSKERSRASRDGRHGASSPGRALPWGVKALEPLRVLGFRRGLGRCGLLAAGQLLAFVPNHGERHPSVADVRVVTVGLGLPERGLYAADRCIPSGESMGPCVRTGAWWAYSGGNWMVASGVPVRRGARGSRAGFGSPLSVPTNLLPLRGLSGFTGGVG